MKTFILISGLLTLLPSVSFAGLANQTPAWAEIERGDQLVLNQSLKINDQITLASGQGYQVEESEGLDGIAVEWIKLKANQCSIPGVRTEIEVLADGNGIQLLENCEVQIFVEFRDLYQASYFELKPLNAI